MRNLLFFLLQCIVRTNETCEYGEVKQQNNNKAKPVNVLTNSANIEREKERKREREYEKVEIRETLNN